MSSWQIPRWKSVDEGEWKCIEAKAAHELICQDDLAADHIMTCLGEGCQSRFRVEDVSRPTRCGVCRLFFCTHHIKSGFGAAEGYPLELDDESLMLGVLLGLPLCKPSAICQTCEAAAQPQEISRPAECGAPEVVLAIRIKGVLAEAQKLRDLSLVEFDQRDADEEVDKTVARELWKLAQGRSRRCLRQWTEMERQRLLRLSEELCKQDPTWLVQFMRQVRWGTSESEREQQEMVELFRGYSDKLSALDKLHCVIAACRRLRQEGGSTTVFNELVECTVESLRKSPDRTEMESDIACVLELLLEVVAVVEGARKGEGATSPTNNHANSLIDFLVEVATGGSASFRGALFWALEAISRAGDPPWAKPSPWAGHACARLMQSRDAETELYRQQAWVRQLERSEYGAAGTQMWRARPFPVAVWNSEVLCHGLSAHRKADSKAAPLIADCETNKDGVPAGVLMKRDSGLQLEQQVGQLLRLLEFQIWRNEELLKRAGLCVEDTRVTYRIVMTGPDTAMVELVGRAWTLEKVRATCVKERGSATDCLQHFLRKHCPKDAQGILDESWLKKAKARLAFTSAVSAVLSYVAGLGDRHHENFMITQDGRLLHVDYGYALGKEPVDSKAIQWVANTVVAGVPAGGKPPTVVHYSELMEVLDKQEFLDPMFWPAVEQAYWVACQHGGLLTEFVFAAETRSMSSPNSAALKAAYERARCFVASRCVPTISSAATAAQFINQLILYSTRSSEGADWRDSLKGYHRSFREWLGGGK